MDCAPSAGQQALLAMQSCHGIVFLCDASLSRQNMAQTGITFGDKAAAQMFTHSVIRRRSASCISRSNDFSAVLAYKTEVFYNKSYKAIGRRQGKLQTFCQGDLSAVTETYQLFQENLLAGLYLHCQLLWIAVIWPLLQFSP